MKFLPIFLSFVYAFMNVVGATLIKIEINKGHQLNSVGDYINLLFTVRVVSGFAIILLATMALFKALSMANYSMVVPISAGFNFIVTALAAAVVLKENINLTTIIAYAIILAGITLLSFANNSAA